MSPRGDDRVLAIDGGSPVRAAMLPYGHQMIDDDDVESVLRALRSEWLTTGPEVDRFEAAFADFVGADHAVAVSSGTAALHAAAFAAGIGPGDEVIVPPLSFVATANGVRYVGATPVFADVRDDSLTLDSQEVERAITPRTRAIITVDYGGQPSDLDELCEIARRHRLVLIEDSAHAVGAEYRGRRVGSIADLTTFSLHPVKQLTSGEGGVITTANPDLAHRARTFRNHGISADARQRGHDATWAYDVTALGYNYRLTDLQCALGSSQLRKLPRWLARRRSLAGRMLERLHAIDTVEPLTSLGDRLSAWHLFVVKLRLDRLSVDRTAVFAALRAENIGVNVHYIPIPWHTLYRDAGYLRGQWPRAESAYERILTLPLWAGMTDDDADDVMTALAKVCAAYTRR